jgi:uncharacterized membrane protein YdjX (TVP38/TMEM64 family)
VVLALVGVATARLAETTVLPRIEMFLQAMQMLGGVGWLAFVTLQVVVAASGVLPASLLATLAGAVYGIPIGAILAAASTMAGAELAMFLSRAWFRSEIEHLLHRRPRLQHLDAMIAQEGWRLVCMLRISPVMPFAATSYMLGLSTISLRDYTLGTLASLPALFGYVCLGSFARAGLRAGVHPADSLRWALLAAGALATVLLTGASRRIRCCCAAPRPRRPAKPAHRIMRAAESDRDRPWRPARVAADHQHSFR